MAINVKGVFLSILGGLSCIVSAIAGEGNLLLNSGFESLKNSLPENFSTGKHSGGEGSFAIDEKIVHSGKYSIRISKENAEGRISVNQTREIPVVTEARKFSVSVWVFAEDVKAGSITVWGSDGKNTREQWTTIATFNGTFEWKNFSGTVTFPAGVKSVSLSVRLSGKGIAWIDDCDISPLDDAASAGNFISNPDMGGAVNKNTGLPAGWQKKMVSGGLRRPAILKFHRGVLESRLWNCNGSMEVPVSVLNRN